MSDACPAFMRIGVWLVAVVLHRETSQSSVVSTRLINYRWNRDMRSGIDGWKSKIGGRWWSSMTCYRHGTVTDLGSDRQKV